MKKIKLFIFALIACFIFSKNTFAIEDETCKDEICKVYDSGSEEILTYNISIFEDELRQRVLELNEKNSQGYLIRYTYSYKLDVVSTTTNIEKDKKEIIEVQELFVSQKDAINYFDRVEIESPYVKGEYFISSTTTPKIIEGEVKEIKCESLDCKKELEELEKSLKDNQTLNKKIEIKDVLTDEIIKVDYKENNEVKYFDTEAEAKLFTSTYIPELSGYKFIENEVSSEIITIPTLKTYLELKGKDTYDTETEANSLLAEFKVEYPNATGSVKKIANGSSSENGTLPSEFTTESDAQNKAEEITKDTDIEKVVASVRAGTKKTEEENISGEYSTKDQAEAAINELKNAGYIVNASINEVSNGITGNVENGTKYDSSSRYELPIDKTNFVLIKQGSGHYAVWTEYELTDTEKNTFVATYNSVNSGSSKFDGSTTGISKEDITWIYGFESHNLSYIGSNWGTYTFTKDGNNIVLTCKADKVSHIIAGYATPKVKYILTGTKYKEEKVWYVDYTKTTYSFLYKIEASAIIDEKFTKYKVVSNFEKLGKEATLIYSIDTTIEEINYKLSYEKYIPIVSEISKLDWTIYQCSYPYGGDVEELPPQTGVETNLYINYLLMIIIIASSVIVQKLLKNN